MSENNGTTGNNPFERTMPLAIDFHMLGVSRKVSTDQVEAQTDKDMLRVSKKILDCEEYAAITTAKGAITAYLRRKAVPGGGKLFRSSTYPIPVAMVGEVDEKLRERIGTFYSAVEAFLAVYETRKNEAMSRLDSLANNADYPPLDRVRAAFGVEFQYVSFGAPASLAGISEDIYRREVQRIQEQCRSAAEDVKFALRSAFQDLLAHMVDKLTPGEDGKKKKFYDSSVANFREFMDTFSARNITSDSELEDLVSKCRSVLNGKSAEQLRKDDDSRAIVRDAMGTIKTALDGMITVQKSRQITLED